MKSNNKKVLIPIDDSAFSLGVIPYVTRLLEPASTDLFLMHVAHNPNAVIVDEQIVVYADQEAASMEASGKAEMQPYVRSLEAIGFHVTPIVSFGDPATEIEHVVEERDIDLIAMTTHGRTGIARMVHGSVAQQVLKLVDVPVLLYRTDPDESDESALGE